MVNAEIAGDAGACGELAFDIASGGHGGFVGKQGGADFPLAIRSASTAHERAVLSPAAEFLRGYEAAFPKSLPVIAGASFVVLEPPLGGFKAQRETLADKRLIQAHGLALDGADADVPLFIRRVSSQILTADLAISDQLYELIAGLDAAGPAVGMGIDAKLVDCRYVDAVEPIGYGTELKRAAVSDRRRSGQSRACPNDRQ